MQNFSYFFLEQDQNVAIFHLQLDCGGVRMFQCKKEEQHFESLLTGKHHNQNFKLQERAFACQCLPTSFYSSDVHVIHLRERNVNRHQNGRFHDGLLKFGSTIS